MPSALRIGLCAVLVVATLTAGALPVRSGSAEADRTGALTVSVAPSTPTVGVPGTPVTVAVPPALPDGAVAVGAVPSAWTVAVAVGLASRDPAGLAAYVDAESTPGTSEYRHPLSAAAAADRFGAAPASVRAAAQYFARFGLATSANPDGLLLYVAGSGAEIGAAFSTGLVDYRLASGRIAYRTTGPATLPTVAPWTGAYGLSNFTPIAPETTAVADRSEPSPAAGCGTIDGALAPCQIATAYNFTDLRAAGDNGTGETLAVVDAYSGREPQTTLESDLASFAASAGIGAGAVHYLYPVPTTESLNSSGTNPGWGLEEALDLEWARGIAPGATVDMTFSPNPGAGLYAAIDWLVARAAVRVISLSWGEPDVGIYDPSTSSCTAGCNATTDGSYAVLGPVLELAAAEGISVFAASGDCGAADGTAGVATNFPASDPYVTGVGGTVLSVAANGDYLSETAWSGNESGATGSCTNGGGSGGGYAPTPAPWWQTGLPAGHAERGVPDVALDADTPVYIEYQGAPAGVIGTSVATPIWAGIAAIADQHAGAALGLLDPSLYRILASSRYAADFHDITSGSNGYRARIGWDPVTGIGTPIVDSLVDDLAAGGGLPGLGLSVNLTASPSAGPSPLTVRFAVVASGGTPPYRFEEVSFGDANATLAPDGTAAYTYAVPGVYLAQAVVADARGNETVSAPVPVIVGGGSDLNVTLRVGRATLGAGRATNFSATVTGGTGPYTYDFWFGNGASINGSRAEVSYAYPTAGLYCPVVVVTDSAVPADGGISPPLEVQVGGDRGAACGFARGPLTVSPESGLGPQDAPADLGSLFSVTGGDTGSGAPAPNESYASTDPYVVACQCALFPTAGNYSTTLTVTDALGDQASGSANVTIAPPLVGTFTASALSGPAPLTVDFGATARGGYEADAASTVWTFGPPGSTATGASVAWTYATPGEYVATALLTDAGNGTASESFLLDVTPAGGPTVPGLTATIGPSRAIRLGATVGFAAAAVDAPAGAEIVWGLGDGNGAAGAAANETYDTVPATDLLAVSLVLEGTNFTPLATAAIDLADFVDTPTPGVHPAADALALAGTVGPTFGVPVLAVDGTATASGPGTAAIAWTFDGVPGGTGPDVAHDFSVPGNYTVVVRASDPFGDRAVESTRVEVVRPLALAAGLSPGGGDAPLLVRYRADPSGGVGGPYNYSWTFGTGGASAAADGGVRFSAPGTYSVRLVVTDRAGESIAENWTVTVGVPTLLFAAIVGAGVGTGAILAIVLGRSGRRGDPRTADNPGD